MEEIKRCDTVVLVYTDDDLADEDLGMSGIVLKSPLDDFRYDLKAKYYYIGCLKEDEERVVIQRMDYQKFLKGRPMLSTRQYIRKWTREDEDAEWEKTKWHD